MKKMNYISITSLMILVMCATFQSCTSLQRCAAKGDISCMKTLLSKGENIKLSDSKGWTPLMWAVYYDQFNAVRFLIENGSDVNARSAKNYGSIAKDSTALIIASYYGNTRTAGLLLASGANPKIINTNKETARSIAEQYGFAEITSLLTTGKTGQAKLASDALADSTVERNVMMTLNDGSKIDGIFVSQTKTAIIVKTKNGHMTFEKDRIWEFRFK